MSFLKYRGSSSLRRPLTFITPSLVSDTPQARVKVKRDLRAILRLAEGYLGREEFDQLVQKHRMARRGRKPDRALDALVLAEYDAATAKGPVDIPEFSKAFYKKHGQGKHNQGHSAEAIDKRLRRLLPDWEREQKLKAAVKRPSLLNE